MQCGYTAWEISYNYCMMCLTWSTFSEAYVRTGLLTISARLIWSPSENKGSWHDSRKYSPLPISWEPAHSERMYPWWNSPLPSMHQHCILSVVERDICRWRLQSRHKIQGLPEDLCFLYDSETWTYPQQASQHPGAKITNVVSAKSSKFTGRNKQTLISILSQVTITAIEARVTFK